MNPVIKVHELPRKEQTVILSIKDAPSQQRTPAKMHTLMLILRETIASWARKKKKGFKGYD